MLRGGRKRVSESEEEVNDDDISNKQEVNNIDTVLQLIPNTGHVLCWRAMFKI